MFVRQFDATYCSFNQPLRLQNYFWRIEGAQAGIGIRRHASEITANET